MNQKVSTVTTTQQSQVVGAKLTLSEIQQIQQLVTLGEYLGVSDFVRSAVREKLDATDVIQTRNLPYKTVKKEVLGYFQKYQEAYPSDCANALEIDLETVHRATMELIKEKRLEANNN